MRRIKDGQISPSFVITHTVRLDAGSRDVQGVPRQAARLHQGRDEAVNRHR
jgi:hypothetical protein